jgi:hydroxyacyl-ACP dehydratase HTD2-like protein with hotdog domain
MSRAIPTLPPPVPYRRRMHAPSDITYRRPLESRAVDTPARLELETGRTS